MGVQFFQKVDQGPRDAGSPEERIKQREAKSRLLEERLRILTKRLTDLGQDVSFD